MRYLIYVAVSVMIIYKYEYYWLEKPEKIRLKKFRRFY